MLKRWWIAEIAMSLVIGALWALYEDNFIGWNALTTIAMIFVLFPFYRLLIKVDELLELLREVRAAQLKRL